MRNHDLDGIAVIDAADAEEIGRLTSFALDATGRRINSFMVEVAEGEARSRPSPHLWLGVHAVRSLSTERLVADACRLSIDPVNPGDRPIADVIARRVLTQDRSYVGRLVSVEFDPSSFDVTHLEVSPGVFAGNYAIPMHRVVSIGPDVVIADDAVLLHPRD